IGRIDADSNRYAGIAANGGKDMYIGTLNIRNSWIFYRDAPIIDSYFSKIKIDVNREEMTTTSPHIFRTMPNDSFRIGTMEITNKMFDPDVSGDENIEKLKGATQAVFSTRNGIVVDN